MMIVWAESSWMLWALTEGTSADDSLFSTNYTKTLFIQFLWDQSPFG